MHDHWWRWGHISIGAIYAALRIEDKSAQLPPLFPQHLFDRLVHASLPHFVVLLVSVRFQSFDANILLKYMKIDYDLDIRNRKEPFHGTGPHAIGLSVVYPPADGTRYLCWMLWFLGPNQPIGLTGTRENMCQKKLITQQWTLSSS
jgi:hypothetical protein